MKKTFSRFSFNTIDDVVSDVSSSSYMATIDLQDAQRSVPIHPENRKHFALRWDFGSSPVYLTDNFVCFGSKCSAFIFTRLTDAVTRYIKSEGYTCSWWQTFAENFNGCADFFDPVTDTIELYTDACLTGLAAICQNDFYHAKLVTDDTDEIYYSCSSPNPYEVTVSRIHGANINVFELIAVLLALIPWNPLLTNCRVLCYCDNLQVCYNLCKDQTLCITVLLPCV